MLMPSAKACHPPESGFQALKLGNSGGQVNRYLRKFENFFTKGGMNFIMDNYGTATAQRVRIYSDRKNDKERLQPRLRRGDTRAEFFHKE
jgi:hypothetical protein